MEEVAEDKDKTRSSWLNVMLTTNGLQRYSPAQFTQEIAVTDGVDRISRVHRSHLVDPHKWAQPGGMFNIRGWKSDLYKYTPNPPYTYVDDIAVWNGSNFQNNRGWKRHYHDGTVFADVLSNADTGKVFEVRLAEKNNGKWDRYVAFKDPIQRPIGYHGLKQKCSVCHNYHDGPGTGGYGTGLVLGGDTIVSDPFPALER